VSGLIFRHLCERAIGAAHLPAKATARQDLPRRVCRPTRLQTVHTAEEKRVGPVRHIDETHVFTGRRLEDSGCGSDMGLRLSRATVDQARRGEESWEVHQRRSEGSILQAMAHVVDVGMKERAEIPPDRLGGIASTTSHESHAPPLDRHRLLCFYSHIIRVSLRSDRSPC
jgi:hypothetical protein